jgi:hypothetical protein
MDDLLHRAAAILEPLWRRVRDVILIRPVVVDDETRLRLVREKDGKTKNGSVWTFGARNDNGGHDVVYGPRRRVAFLRSLVECFDDGRVFGLASSSVDVRDRPVLRFRRRDGIRTASGTSPVEHVGIGHDPRRYDDNVVPADDLEQQADAIAALHVAHSSWPATRAAVDACANGVIREGRRLLSMLAARLQEPRIETWTGLCALADEDADCRRPDWQGCPPEQRRPGPPVHVIDACCVLGRVLTNPQTTAPTTSAYHPRNQEPSRVSRSMMPIAPLRADATSSTRTTHNTRAVNRGAKKGWRSRAKKVRPRVV